jgi:hypothetical protein
MTPTEKSPAIENMLERIGGRTTAITGNKCIPAPIGCGQPILGFNDPRSEREYRISGLCQKCQDEFLS